MKLLQRQHFGFGLSTQDTVAALHKFVLATPCLNLSYRDGADAVQLLQEFAGNAEDFTVSAVRATA